MHPHLHRIPNPSAKPRLLRRTFAAGAALFGLVWFAAGIAAQQPTPPPPAATPLPVGAPGAAVVPQAPAPTPVATQVGPTPTPYPPDDPNDPTASREERFRRQRLRIQRELEAGRRQRLGLPPLETPTPTPTPTPLAGNTLTTPGLATTTGTATTTASTHSGLGVTDKARIPHATFYLTPASHTVGSGEQFATKARLHNPDNLALDRVRIALSWPPRNMQPASIHQDRLKARLKGEPRITLDRDNGTLVYEAELTTPLDAMDIDLITIVWEAIDPAENFQVLPYLMEGDALLSTAAWYGEREVTATSEGLYDALAGARVNVRAQEGTVPQPARMVAPTLEAMESVLIGLPDQSTLRAPTLYIDQPVGRKLAAGEWVMIEIGLNNPDQMAFDEVRLGGRFNPAVVEFADTDTGNYISTGVNMLDGPFHVLWPWDRHHRNVINNTQGTFYYRMGMSQWREQPSGPLVRLFGRVLRETEGPLLTWTWDPGKAVDDPTTGIYLLSENIYQRGEAVPDPRRAITSTNAGYLPADPKIEKAPPELYRNPEVMQ